MISLILTSTFMSKGVSSGVCADVCEMCVLRSAGCVVVKHV